MQKSILALLLFLPVILLTQDCILPNALRTMNTPRAEFMHSSGATLWWNGQDAFSQINDPTLSNHPSNVAFAAGIWYGTSDNAGNLSIRTSQYDLYFGTSSYTSGPITADFPNASICDLFNRIWEVSDADVSAFLADWEDNQSIDAPIPENIKLWPGRNNIFIETEWGIALPDRTLAPFHDRNNNGDYEPNLGDYPNINNAKIAHWWMFNDAGPDAPSMPNTATTDFAVLAYSFDGDDSNTTTYFYEYRITNRSNQDFPIAKLGLWVDPDLGCYTDDFIGCKPDQNLAYAYNVDAIDGQVDGYCPNDVPVFDQGIPLFGIKVLDGTDRLDANMEWIDNGMSSFIYHFGGIIDPPLATLGPNSPNAYWNALSGVWNDGTPLTVGGLGYNPSSSDTTHFAYPDDPDELEGWNLCLNGGFPIADRRMLIGSGPFALSPGEEMKFAFAAIVTGVIDDYPCPSLDPLIEAAELAQTTYDGIISTSATPDVTSALSIFPNPTTGISKLDAGTNTITILKVYDAIGNLISHQKNIKLSSVDLDLSAQAPGIYYVQVQYAQGGWETRKVIKFHI